MVRIKTAIAVGATAMAVGAVMSPAAAQANVNDRGTAGANCVNGEICFNYAPGSSSVYRHFFNDADHRGDHFDGSAFRLEDNIVGYRNLDTQCTVYVWDITSTGRWYVYSTIGSEYPQAPTRVYRTYSAGDQNRNNGHTRCQSGTPPIGR